MDIELSLKIISLVFASIAAWKVLYEITTVKRGRMRDEYKFAKEFFKDIQEKELHPFLREKGYRIISGDDRLTIDETVYLLTLKNPERAIKDFVLGRAYLEHLPHAGNLQINFRSKYQKTWSRRWRKVSYSVLYGLFVFIGFAPMLFNGKLHTSIANLLVLQLLTWTIFLPYAWVSLKAAARIHRAEKLVQHQDKHTQTLYLEPTRTTRRIHTDDIVG